MKRYAVAGILALAFLILAGWFAFREVPLPAEKQQTSATSSKPLARHVTPQLPPADRTQNDASTSPPTESAATNAAALYLRAFALYDALSKEQKELISSWQTNVDSSVEMELCEKIRPICDLMHQAGALTNCDWELKRPFTDDTLKAFLPNFTSSRGIARAAIWSAAHCRTGDNEEAVDDVIATSRLGHKLPPMLISHLVDLAIQWLALDFTAQHASTLVGGGDTRLFRLFEDSSFDEQLSRALANEADFSKSQMEKLAATTPDEARRALSEMPAQAQSIDPNQVIPYLRQAKELQLEYVRALQLPEAEYRECLTRLHAAEKTNPLVGIFVSAYESVVDKTRAMTVRTAMVTAGLAVTRDGQEALQSHVDPSTGQPFAYVETDEGFELQSSYEVNGSPIKLQFK